MRKLQGFAGVIAAAIGVVVSVEGRAGAETFGYYSSGFWQVTANFVPSEITTSSQVLYGARDSFTTEPVSVPDLQGIYVYDFEVGTYTAMTAIHPFRHYP